MEAILLLESDAVLELRTHGRPIMTTPDLSAEAPSGNKIEEKFSATHGFCSCGRTHFVEGDKNSQSLKTRQDWTNTYNLDDKSGVILWIKSDKGETLVLGCACGQAEREVSKFF